MNIRVVESNGIRLAVHIDPTDVKEGLNFYSADGDNIQVGTWKYDLGKHLPPHIHNRGTNRNVDRTQEVVYVITGRMKASVYSEDAILVGEIEAKAGDIVIMLAGGHGYEILSNNTRVLEVKNGPYIGVERDRRRIKGEDARVEPGSRAI